MDDLMLKWPIVWMLAAAMALAGCAPQPRPYGIESRLELGGRRQVWAVCPAINLSGERVDPILQADLLFQQLQEVQGLTVIPVDRTVQVFAALGIDQIQSQTQVDQVCQALGCDALAIPTVTIFDPFNPPKMGASLSLMRSSNAVEARHEVNPDKLVRQGAPSPQASMPPPPRGFLQVVGMFDASNGSTRQAVLDYAAGRNDPLGPMGSREYFQSMSRYCGFVYHTLIGRLLEKM